MATTIFNNNILRAAKILKEARTLATDDGDRYSSAMLADYQNRAVRSLITEMVESLGVPMFADKFPEYIATSGVLTLVSGLVALPSDCYRVIDVAVDDYSTYFDALDQADVVSVKTGRDGLVVPVFAEPVHYQEGSRLYTLGITSGTIVVRYIRLHVDMSPITAATGNGFIYSISANISYTAATRTLLIESDIGMDSGDVNKLVTFNTASIVYAARIDSVTTELAPDKTFLVLRGDGLPAGDIAALTILNVLVSDVDPDANDLKLNEAHSSEIVRRMVELATLDTRAIMG